MNTKNKSYIPKFQVGDVIRYKDATGSDIGRKEIILTINETEYLTLVFPVNKPSFEEDFDIDETDKYMELDPESLLLKEFDSDLDALLKE